MSLMENITGTIKDPRKTMKNIADQPMIEEAVMIVGIYAVLGAVGALLMSDKITYIFEGMEDLPSSMESIMKITSTVGALIMAFVVWIAGTAIVHFISMMMGGEGKFYPQMLTVVGFGIIPLVFGNILGIILFSMMEPMTLTISPTNQHAAEELLNNTYISTSKIFGILMQVWTAVIIFFGVQSAHRLTKGKAMVAAGIPLAISLIFVVGSSSML